MPQTSWSNKDLTPAAMRKRLGLEDHTDKQDNPLDYGRGGHVAPDAPGESETDRLLRESKDTLSRVDPFAKMLDNAGNVAAEQSREDHGGGYNEAAIRSLGDTSVGVMKGAAQIPGDLLAGALGLPGTIAHGYASIPEGLGAMIDPDTGSFALPTARGTADAAKGAYEELANDPETATRLFGGMLAAGPAGDLAGAAIGKAPGFAGGAISKVGRGMQAVSQSPVLKGTGMFRKAGAVLHPGVGTALAAVGPELLEAGGRGVEALGNRVTNIPNSPALAALKNLANKDLGLAAKKFITPDLTAEEQAAASVRATVDAAKNGVANGLSRAQADQRAGWPLGESTAEKHTTPGADVEAHRPYAPAVRGKAGNVITPGRGHVSSLSALDDLAGPSSRLKSRDMAPGEFEQQLRDSIAQPKRDLMDDFQASQANPAEITQDTLEGPRTMRRNDQGSHVAVDPVLEGIRNPDRYSRPQDAAELLSNPESQRFMNDEFTRNHRAPATLEDSLNYGKAENARDTHLNAVAADDPWSGGVMRTEGPVDDLSGSLSPLDRASRTARLRALARAMGKNSPLAEGL